MMNIKLLENRCKLKFLLTYDFYHAIMNTYFGMKGCACLLIASNYGI
jgi:ribosome-associated toxin RatA of RatAB toxin-antitoxin module